MAGSSPAGFFVQAVVPKLYDIYDNKKMDGGKFLRHFCETHNPNLHPTAKMKMSLFATAGIK